MVLIPHPLPTQKRYRFEAKVERIVMPRVKWNESAKCYENTTDPWECAILVPIQSGGMEQFLNAWLPQQSDKQTEVVLRLESPIFLPGVRVAPRRPDKFCPRCYLFVMSEPDTPAILYYRGKKVLCHSFDEKQGEDVLSPEIDSGQSELDEME